MTVSFIARFQQSQIQKPAEKMALKFDFDEALRNLIHQVDEKLQASCSKNEVSCIFILVKFVNKEL